MSTTTDTRLSRYLEDQNEKPQFEHDCESCIFLGHSVKYGYRPDDQVIYDLYFHPAIDQASGLTVVARFGPESDYYSGLESGMPPLIEARQRVFRYFEIQNLRP